jgi:hypothetical protein
MQSIWDDDLVVGSKYMEHCVNTSKKYGDALVSPYGWTVRRLRYGKHVDTGARQNVNRSPLIFGEDCDVCDYMGTMWTFKTNFITAMWNTAPATFFTSEDMHLSWGMQQIGVRSVRTPGTGDPEATAKCVDGLHDDTGASWKKPQHLRNFKILEMLAKGFKPINCFNCDEPTIRQALLANDWGEQDKLLAKRARQVLSGLDSGECNRTDGTCDTDP